MRRIFRLLAILIMGLAIVRPVSSYADWHDGNGHSNSSDNHGHDGNWHGHDHGYIGIGFSVSPDNYYYGAPYYPPEDAVLVSPPEYDPVAVNGATYYVNNGTYYVYNGYSYQAVAPPVTYVQAPVTVVQPSEPEVITPAPPATSEDTSDAYTINIPNDKGGYTAVILKKSGTGFTGPQGELYTSFPSVNQLKVIYGK